MNANRLFAVFAQLSEAPNAMLQLRRFVLDLAVRGELVPSDVETEAIPATPRIVRTEMTRGNGLTEARPYLVPPTWNWHSIEEVAVQVSDGEHATPARIVDHQVPLVTAKNVRDGKMVYDQTDWVSHETAVKAWGRCRPIPGDILLVCVGATIGRLCVLREKRDMVLVRSVALIRPSTKVDADFLALALRSPAGQAEMWRRAKVAAQPCLYLNRIRTLSVPVPPLAEQHRIVARVNELMALCDELKAAQEERERRRDALRAASLARVTGPEVPGDGVTGGRCLLSFAFRENVDAGGACRNGSARGSWSGSARTTSPYRIMARSAAPRRDQFRSSQRALSPGVQGPECAEMPHTDCDNERRVQVGLLQKRGCTHPP